MPTLKRTRLAPLAVSEQLRRRLLAAPGDLIQINEDNLLILYRDNIESQQLLRAELLHRPSQETNRQAMHYWCYLPEGYAADLFPFAPLYVFIHDAHYPGLYREQQLLLLEFVDFGSPVECALNRIQVAA